MAESTGQTLTPPFPCDQCGLCCQNVHLSETTWALDRGDGTCHHYQADERRCSIYATRPDICRVDRQYLLHYAKRYSWPDFVQANVQVCDLLKTHQLPHMRILISGASKPPNKPKCGC